jgi:hypothetical protein
VRFLHFMLLVVLVSLSAVALAQSDAQESFDKLKTLAGSWEGTVEGKPPASLASRDIHGCRAHA